MSDRRSFARPVANAAMFFATLFIGSVAAPEIAVAGVQAPQSAAKRLSELGPQGVALATRTGTWDVTLTIYSRTGGAPVTVSGLVAERRMIGPMLEEVLRSVPGASGAPFERVDDLLFNRLEGRWDYMSMDSSVPDGLMVAWSRDDDPGQRIVVTFLPFATAGSGAVPTGQMFRMEQIIIREDADHEVKDQYFTPAGEAKWLAKRYRYTRRAPQ